MINIIAKIEKIIDCIEKTMQLLVFQIQKKCNPKSKVKQNPLYNCIIIRQSLFSKWTEGVSI